MRIGVRDLRSGTTRELTVGDAATIGSAADRDVRLSGQGVLAEHAVLSRIGHHVAVVLHAGGDAYAHGVELAPERPVILDEQELVIGSWALRVLSAAGSSPG